MSMSGFDIFSLVATVISLLAILYGLIRSQLPSTKIKRLNAIYNETKDIFDQGLEEGLLSDDIFVSNAAYHLYIYDVERNGLRIRVFSARSITDQLIEMTRGLSFAISELSTRVARLRLDIMMAGETERGKLMRVGRLQSRWRAMIRPGHGIPSIDDEGILGNTGWSTKRGEHATPLWVPSPYMPDPQFVRGRSGLLPVSSSAQHDTRRCVSCPPTRSDILSSPTVQHHSWV